GGREPGLPLLERAGVGEQRDPLARADAKRIVALGTCAPDALDLRTVHDLLTGVALDPQAFGDVDLLRCSRHLLGLASEPGHKCPSEGGYAPLPTVVARLTARSSVPPPRIARAKPALEPARRDSFSVAMKSRTVFDSEGATAPLRTSPSTLRPRSPPSSRRGAVLSAWR